MRVALLSPKPQTLTDALARTGDEAITTADLIDADFIRKNGINYIVSYGYRHILPLETLRAASAGNCNLHISMLPWNRGADPNFWSWVDGTPKGVTIHRMIRGLDTGPILCQEEVSFSDDDSLATSYAKLGAAIEQLFFQNWPAIRSGMLSPKPQTGIGSYHRASDKEEIWRRLPLGFDTKCTSIRNLSVADPAP